MKVWSDVDVECVHCESEKKCIQIKHFMCPLLIQSSPLDIPLFITHHTAHEYAFPLTSHYHPTPIFPLPTIRTETL
jgi:hypothetical protein